MVFTLPIYERLSQRNQFIILTSILCAYVMILVALNFFATISVTLNVLALLIILVNYFFVKGFLKFVYIKSGEFMVTESCFSFKEETNTKEYSWQEFNASESYLSKVFYRINSTIAIGKPDQISFNTTTSNNKYIVGYTSKAFFVTVTMYSLQFKQFIKDYLPFKDAHFVYTSNYRSASKTKYLSVLELFTSAYLYSNKGKKPLIRKIINKRITPISRNLQSA